MNSKRTHDLRLLHKRVLIYLCIFSFLFEAFAFSSPGLIYAATPVNSNKVKLSVMINKTAQEMDKYKQLFESRYPNVEISYISYDDYETKAKELIETGNFPDVAYIPGSLPSNEYPTYFDVLGDASDLSAKYNYLEQSKRDGSKVYGIPSYAYLSGFVYNKAVFEKAGITSLPKSTDEFLADLQNIKDYTDATPFYTNYVSDWALNIWETFPFIDSTGDPDYMKNGFVNEKNPFKKNSSHYEVYNLLYEIVNQGLCEDNIGEGDWEKSKKLLNEGKIACVALGSWALSQFKNAGKNSNDVSFMPFPTTIDGKQYSTITTDYCYGLNKKSSHKTEARNYIDFMINESGYALDNETLSIVKTDPYPDGYSMMKDVNLAYNHVASNANSGIYEALSAKLNFSDGKEAKRVMDAAAGKTNESMTDILNDWNKRWESSRTADMKTQEDVPVFSSAEIQSEDYHVNLSSSEKEYIKKNTKLKVGYLNNFAPFQYEQGNNFSGVASDIFKIISQQTGFEFEYKAYSSYNDLVDAIKSNKIDIIAGIEKASAYTDDILLSKSYANFSNVIIKNNNVKIDEIDKKQAVTTKGNRSDYFNGTDNISFETNFTNVLKSISSGKADYTITNYYTANYYMKEDDYSNLSTITTTSENGMYLGFPQNTDARMIAICNKCLYSISNTKIELMILDNMDSTIHNLNLRRLIKLYPIQTVLIISFAFILVLSIILWIMHEKSKNAKRHELDAKRYRMLSDLTDEYMFDYNCEKNELYFDRKFNKFFNFSGTLNLREYDDDNPSLNAFIIPFMELKSQDKTNMKNILFEHQDGQKIWYRLIISKLYNDKHQLIQVIGKIVNIQKEMEERQKILDKAERDPLTNLFNRNGFYSVVNRLHEKNDKHATYAYGILDIDNFKHVNDTLGHQGGDEALRLLSSEMQKVFGDHAILARYGGDEFVFYLPLVQTKEEITTYLKHLVASMDRSFEFENKTIHLSISVGAVMASNENELDSSFKKADEQLYKVKEASKNNFQLYELA